jgi:ankyrin repeat protein
MDARELPLHPNLQQYKKLAKELVKICKSSDPATLRREGTSVTVTREQVLRRHPRLAKLSESERQNARFTLADAQFMIAREYGFKSWSKFAAHIDALAAENSPVSTFEAAVEAVTGGDLATLKCLLGDHPQLVQERSTRVHKATLLHYVSANGVEDYRQKTPENAVRIAEALLSAGAPVDALAQTYGGGSAQTTLCLLVSSIHPAKAGLQAALVETLADFGAAINGLENDGLPLMTALAFWYTDAAEALVRRGARVDNIIAAAALGQLEKVKSFINKDGSLKADLPPVIDPWGGWIEKEKQMGQALIRACLSGQTRVVEFLLEKGVDPSAGANIDQTGFHYAAHSGHMEIVKLLIGRKVSMEMQNRYGGTVLGQAVWSAINEPKPDHIPIIEALLEAGADVEAAGYPTGNEHIDRVLHRFRAESGKTD